MSLSRVGAVLLAAGGSRRMGVPKQLMVYGGESLLRRAARVALGAGVGRVAVVLGSEAGRLETELAGLPVEVVHNPRWAEGMSTSVRAGLEALERGPDPLDAVLLMLCDQPHVDAGLLQGLIRRQAEEDAGIVACEYAGTAGVPAVFAARYFPRLRALSGDKGARQLLQAEDVLRVPFEPGGVDIDTPEDYARLGQEPGAAV